MEDKLIELLSTFGFPVFLQGSLSDDEQYPDDFFTFWERPSYDGSHYDNNSVSCIYEYDVNFYSTTPKNPYDYIKRAKKLLKENGFIVSGNGQSVYSGTISHTGRSIGAMYSEREA